uniref:Complex III assembly factor LYRM7 n=1 Tax=Ciona savignyi TaxID=51511 RepID=H2ZNQ1_CIOSA
MSAQRLLRIKVLAAFKDLHLARLQAFKGDSRALDAARVEINSNFRKNQDVSDPEKIEELITIAKDTAIILRRHVVQLESVAENRYKANITKDTFLLDNTEYQDTPEEKLLEFKRKKKGKKSCSDKDK